MYVRVVMHIDFYLNLLGMAFSIWCARFYLVLLHTVKNLLSVEYVLARSNRFYTNEFYMSVLFPIRKRACGRRFYPKHTCT